MTHHLLTPNVPDAIKFIYLIANQLATATLNHTQIQGRQAELTELALDRSLSTSRSANPQRQAVGPTAGMSRLVLHIQNIRLPWSHNTLLHRHSQITTVLHLMSITYLMGKDHIHLVKPVRACTTTRLKA